MLMGAFARVWAAESEEVKMLMKKYRTWTKCGLYFELAGRNWYVILLLVYFVLYDCGVYGLWRCASERFFYYIERTEKL